MMNSDEIEDKNSNEESSFHHRKIKNQMKHSDKTVDDSCYSTDFYSKIESTETETDQSEENVQILVEKEIQNFAPEKKGNFDKEKVLIEGDNHVKEKSTFQNKTELETAKNFCSKNEKRFSENLKMGKEFCSRECNSRSDRVNCEHHILRNGNRKSFPENQKIKRNQFECEIQRNVDESNNISNEENKLYIQPDLQKSFQSNLECHSDATPLEQVVDDDDQKSPKYVPKTKENKWFVEVNNGFENKAKNETSNCDFNKISESHQRFHFRGSVVKPELLKEKMNNLAKEQNTSQERESNSKENHIDANLVNTWFNSSPFSHIGSQDIKRSNKAEDLLPRIKRVRSLEEKLRRRRSSKGDKMSHHWRQNYTENVKISTRKSNGKFDICHKSVSIENGFDLLEKGNVFIAQDSAEMYDRSDEYVTRDENVRREEVYESVEQEECDQHDYCDKYSHRKDKTEECGKQKEYDDCIKRGKCGECDEDEECTECDTLLKKEEVGNPKTHKTNGRHYQKRDECDDILLKNGARVKVQKHATKDLVRMLSEVTNEVRHECNEGDVTPENDVTHSTRQQSAADQPKKASLPGHPNQVEEAHQSHILFIIVAIFLLCRYLPKYTPAFDSFFAKRHEFNLYNFVPFCYIAVLELFFEWHLAHFIKQSPTTSKNEPWLRLP